MTVSFHVYCRVWRWKNFENRSTFIEVLAKSTVYLVDWYQSISIVDVIGANEGAGGDNWSYKTCKAPVTVTTDKPTSDFLQAGCPFCHPTMSEHWREKVGKAPVRSPPPTYRHLTLLRDQMPFLLPNKQCQSSKGSSGIEKFSGNNETQKHVYTDRLCLGPTWVLAGFLFPPLTFARWELAQFLCRCFTDNEKSAQRDANTALWL